MQLLIFEDTNTVQIFLSLTSHISAGRESLPLQVPGGPVIGLHRPSLLLPPQPDRPQPPRPLQACRSPRHQPGLPPGGQGQVLGRAGAEHHLGQAEVPRDGPSSPQLAGWPQPDCVSTGRIRIQC